MSGFAAFVASLRRTVTNASPAVKTPSGLAGSESYLDKPAGLAGHRSKIGRPETNSGPRMTIHDLMQSFGYGNSTAEKRNEASAGRRASMVKVPIGAAVRPQSAMVLVQGVERRRAMSTEEPARFTPEQLAAKRRADAANLKRVTAQIMKDLAYVAKGEAYLARQRQEAPERSARATAQRMVRLSAEVRGEKFDPKGWVEAPKQHQVKVTAEDMLRANAKRLGQQFDPSKMISGPSQEGFPGNSGDCA